MASVRKTKDHITSLALELIARKTVLKARALRAVLSAAGLRHYKTNWGVFKVIRAAYHEAMKHGRTDQAKAIQYAFVRDNGRYAWR